MSVTKHRSLNEYIESLEGLEEVIFKIVYMSVALNLVSKEEARNYLKKVDQEVSFEEKVIVNHMDVDDIDEQLGDQGRKNYVQNQGMIEADIEGYEKMEFSDPYMHEMKEASNDLASIRKKLNLDRETEEFIHDLLENLSDLRRDYSDINNNFSLEGLEGHLKPHEVESDARKNGSGLPEDLEIQERKELSDLTDIWVIEHNLMVKMISIIEEISLESDRLDKTIETASEHGIHVEDIMKFKKLTEEKKDDFRRVQQVAESIKAEIENLTGE